MLPFFAAYAGMAELADALDSGSSESNFMEVQVLLPAPKKQNAMHSAFSLFHQLVGEAEDLGGELLASFPYDGVVGRIG